MKQASSAKKSVIAAMAEAISRRAELPSLLKKIAWQSLPQGRMYFRALLLIVAGTLILTFTPKDSKAELLGYLMFLMAFNQTVMQFGWRSIDNLYSILARRFGWSDSRDNDEQN